MEQFIHDFIAQWGYIGLFLIIMVDNANIPLPPTEVVLTIAGWFIAHGIFDFFWVFVVSTIAGTAGCLLFYSVIRYTEGAFIPKLQKWLRISDAKMEKANHFFFKYGGLAVLLGRLIPGMRTISMIPAGVFHYPLGKFTFYSLVGTAIWNGTLLYLGHTAYRALQ